MYPIAVYGENGTPCSPVLLLERPLHTDESPICFDPLCPCHQDIETLNEYASQLSIFIQDGLLTVQEADRLLVGLN